MGNCKDLINLDKGHIVMASRLRACPKQQVLWDVSSMQVSVPTKSGPRKDVLQLAAHAGFNVVAEQCIILSTSDSTEFAVESVCKKHSVPSGPYMVCTD